MAMAELPEIIRLNPSLRRRVEELSGEKITACYQCDKCTNGCPVIFAMDIVPHKLIHLLGLGYGENVLTSDTIWVCASCETCSTRCPNGIDIAHVMDTLRQLSEREGVASQKSASRFHASFLSSIKRYGRIYEVGMIVSYILKNEGPFGLLKWAGLGTALFKRGKVNLFPHSIKEMSQVKRIFKQAEGKGQR